MLQLLGQVLRADGLPVLEPAAGDRFAEVEVHLFGEASLFYDEVLFLFQDIVLFIERFGRGHAAT
jgi:hypothetical protein